MNLTGKAVLIIIFSLLCSGCRDTSSDAFSGYANGEFIYLSYHASEKIEKVLVNKGAWVEKGQPLATMESFNADNALRIAEKNYMAERALLQDLRSGDRDKELDVVRAQLTRARAAAKLAKRQLERNQPLYTKHVISATEWEGMEADYAQKIAQVNELSHQLSAKALPARQERINNQSARVASARLQLDKARWDLQQSQIVAPESALVYDVIYRPGERPAAGKPIISLLPPENIKVRFFVPEKDLGALHVGSRIDILCDGCAEPIVGTVHYLSPQAEYSPPVIYSTKRREKLVFMAEARPELVQAQRMKIGQPVQVRLVHDE